MNPRTEAIAQIFRRWLERFTPPASIKGNGRAMQDAADALLRILLKFSPQDGYEPFVRGALDTVEMQMKTRAWPTVHELGAACSNTRKEMPTECESKTLDPHEIAARKIHANQPVGDSWVYGRGAHELVERGLVLESDLKRYRSVFFFQIKDVYGADTAMAMEADYRRRHELAGAIKEIVQ